MSITSDARIEKISSHNLERAVSSLRMDLLKNIFAFYDLQHDPNQTEAYGAFVKDRMTGYILIYNALEFPNVALEGDESVARKLVQYCPIEKMIIHTSPEHWSTITRRFPGAKPYLEDVMQIRIQWAKFKRSAFLRKLEPDDKNQLRQLLSTRGDRKDGDQDRYFDWISKMTVYGVFSRDRLVSCSASFIQLPDIWLIGGIYTHPEHRNKGFATLVTSGITEEALAHARIAALFVRKDNRPAIKAYEKIGYKKVGEKLWVDIGTGLIP